MAYKKTKDTKGVCGKGYKDKNIKDAQEKYDAVKNQHFQEMLRREVST